MQNLYIKKIISDKNNFILIISVLLLLLIHYPYFKSLPPNYGWWQTYAQLSNNGIDIYGELKLKFTPLYIYFYKILLNFSEDIYISISLGILRTILLFLAAYYIYFKITRSKVLSFISANILIYSTIEPESYLPDDYHTFWKIFVLTYLYGTYKLINKLDNNENVKYTLASLVISSLFLFFCKQNVGLLMFCATFCICIHLIIIKKLNFYALIFNVIIFLLGLIGLSSLLNMSLNDVFNLTFNNTSKGPISGIAFNIFRKENFNFIYTSLVIIGLYYVFKYLYKELEINVTQNLKKLLNIFLNNTILSLLFSITILFFSIRFNYSFILYFTFIALFTSFIVLYFKSKYYGLYFYIILCMIYASSLASGIASQDLVYFIIPFFLYLIRGKIFCNNKDQILISLLFLIFINAKLFEIKFNNPYHWWEQIQSPIYESTSNSDISKLKHMSFDDDTFTMLGALRKYTDLFSIENNDVLYYPHIPIYYYLLNKIPFDNQLVYWFDFSESSEINNLIKAIASKGPKVIAIYDPSYRSYVGHSDMKRERVAQFDLINYLNENVKNGTYRLEYYKSFPLEGKKRIKFQKIKTLILCNRSGALLSVDDTPDAIDKVILNCGGTSKEYERWYSLKIFIKN
jgi:hypothetical protein